MTGRIVTTQYISLDGVIEDPAGMEGSGLGDWTGPFTRGPDGDAFKHRELLDARALLFGRRTYVAFAAVFPEVDDEAGYADLVDEYRLMVYPTVLGGGIRLFPDGVAATLSLAECRPFGDGIVLLRYLSRPR